MKYFNDEELKEIKEGFEYEMDEIKDFLDNSMKIDSLSFYSSIS